MKVVTSQELAIAIVKRLRAAGHVSYLTGGCVRDLLLGRTAKDFDVATSARPDELLRLFPGSGEVGAHFGVVLVREEPPDAGQAGSPRVEKAAHTGGAAQALISSERAEVEVATFRSDLDYVDGRHPAGVHFETNPKQDALRRDFTINALMLDPETNEVRDFVGGRADLDAKLIRAIGDPERRFREDHLRLLRAVRFAARLGFEIEPVTFAAIRQFAPLIHTVSAERVRDEIARILTEGGARRGFELLDAAGLLQEVLPEVAALKGVAQPPAFHPEGDVWTHTMMMLEGLREPPLTLALGVLLHDIGKPATFRVADRIRFDGHVEKGIEIAHAMLNRLKFPHHVIETVEALIGNHMKFMEAPRMRDSTLKRFMRQPDFEEHMELHRLDCLSSHGGLDNYEFVRRKQQEVPPEQLKPKPLLTGRELIAAGYQPGPVFGKVLSQLEDAQLEGRITTPAEAMEMARGLLMKLA